MIKERNLAFDDINDVVSQLRRRKDQAGTYCSGF